MEPTELFRKYRPKLFKEIIGQEGACKAVRKMIEESRLPHALMLTGPSGCGKTTLARIIATKIKCSEVDFTEKNSADFRGIDMIRELRSSINLAPIGGKCRVIAIDECHMLTKDAQNALLKPLEEPPSHVYFILLTTDPEKLIPAIVTRCTEIRLARLDAHQLRTLVKGVSVLAKMEISEDVIEKIVEHSDGSARRALVFLDKIRGVEDDAAQLELIDSIDSSKESIALARALLNPRVTWPELAKLIKTIKDEPESVRWLIISYMSSVALGGGPISARAINVIRSFQYNYYDTKKAGLVTSCYDCVNVKR